MNTIEDHRNKGEFSGLKWEIVQLIEFAARATRFMLLQKATLPGLKIAPSKVDKRKTILQYELSSEPDVYREQLGFQM